MAYLVLAVGDQRQRTANVAVAECAKVGGTLASYRNQQERKILEDVFGPKSPCF